MFKDHAALVLMQPVEAHSADPHSPLYGTNSCEYLDPMQVAGGPAMQPPILVSVERHLANTEYNFL